MRKTYHGGYQGRAIRFEAEINPVSRHRQVQLHLTRPVLLANDSSTNDWITVDRNSRNNQLVGSVQRRRQGRGV